MECFSSFKLARGANAYSLYVLALLLLAYLLNQLDRYTLAIVTKPAAQEIHYGDKGCMKLDNVTTFETKVCVNIVTESECEAKEVNGTFGCTWNYTGQGTDYQLLAGPYFILIYTFAAIPISIAADSYNRKVLLGISVAFWSICTLLSGLVTDYWQLAVLRFGLGLGQSGCSPFATSLISDYFAEELRGAALGVYNWGIYTGYSMSFALGNLITNANINGQGWRWTFIIAGIPGIFLGLLIILSVKEPKRTKRKGEDDAQEKKSTCARLINVLSFFARPSVLLLCLGGAIRNAAGYVWAYNTQIYFESIGETRTQIAFYLSWIPMVAGSIGVLVGGFISDRFVVKSGPHARIWVLILSQILAAPFAAGALLLPTPWAYMSLIPTYIIGEMWVSVILAVLVELVPSDVKTTAVAVYFFIISNIGGNMPLVVPLLTKWLKKLSDVTNIEASRYSLLTLYPGEYIIGSAVFLISLLVLRRDIAYIQSLGSPRGSKEDIVTDMEKPPEIPMEQQQTNNGPQTKM